MPGWTLPVPTAPYMLSPVPASILQSGDNPYFDASSALKRPILASDGFTGGSFLASPGSMALMTFFDQALLPGCQSAVPDVSPGSITATPPLGPPVRYQFM